MAATELEKIEDQILQLSPATDAQRWLKFESLKLSEEVLKARWRLPGSQGGSHSLVSKPGDAPEGHPARRARFVT